MECAFPEKFHKAVECFHHQYGPLEDCTTLTDEQKLMFYALEQQATHGPCKEAAPSLWHMRERYKHSAWKSLQNMSAFEAMVHFVRSYEEILGGPVHWGERVDKMMREKDGPVATETEASPNHWDTDVQLYAEPTSENIRFLAEELMRTRRALEKLNEQAAQTVTSNVNVTARSPGVSVGCQSDGGVPPERRASPPGALTLEPQAPPLKPCLLSGVVGKPYLAFIPNYFSAPREGGNVAGCSPPSRSNSWLQSVRM